MAYLRSTSDVPIEILKGFSSDLQRQMDVDVDEKQIHLLSADPPSWISLFADVPWWVKLTGGIYLTEIVKEAAQDSWKNRALLAKVPRSAASTVNRLAVAIRDLVARLPHPTRFKIGLPLPDEHFGTSLDLAPSDVEQIEDTLYLFLAHLPQLDQLIQMQHETGCRVFGGLRLRLLDNGDVEVSWLEKSPVGALGQRREVLRLQAERANS